MAVLLTLQVFGNTIVVDVSTNNSISMVHKRIHTMTGIPCEEYQLVLRGRHVTSLSSCGSEATLSLVMQGYGGMSAATDLHDSVDGTFGDLSAFRRCMHRVHRFTPGITGRELLAEGNRCASGGHWGLFTCGRVNRAGISPSCLHQAFRAGRMDVVNALVSHYGLCVNGSDSGGWTLLHTAMVHGDEASIRHLLTLNAEDRATTDGVHASSLRPELWHRVTGEEAVSVDPWKPAEKCDMVGRSAGRYDR